MKGFFLMIFSLVITATGVAQDVNPFIRKNESPLVCGHRAGIYAQFPENSLPAMDFTLGACRAQSMVLEVDIRRSKDGTLYVLHDATIDRTANGVGNIEELTDAYLGSRRLKLASGELTTEKLLTFTRLLQYARTKNVILMLDIKTDIWKEVLEAVRLQALESRCIVLTFDPSVSKKVRELSAGVTVSCLVKNEEQWNSIRALNIPSQRMIAYIHESTPGALITQLREQGIPVMTDVSENGKGHTTPLSPDHYRRLASEKQLDILITDYPAEVCGLWK